MDSRLTFLKSLVVFSLLLSFSFSFSQSSRIADSLRNVLSKEQLSRGERSRLLSLRAYHHQAIDSSLFLAKEALQIAVDIDSLLLQAGALEEISHLERRLGNRASSVQASLKALQIYETLKLSERQAASYAQLASNYISDTDYKTAILYFKKANLIYLDSDGFGNQILTVLNLGEAYRLAGYLDSATACFNETLKRNIELKNDIVQGYSLGNLGMVYTAQDRLSLAKNSLKEAIEILTSLGDAYSSSTYLAELGKIYSTEGNLTLAEEKFHEALNMATAAGLKEQIRDFTTLLSNFYESFGSYAQALKYQKINQLYQDSLVNKASIRKIEQLKAGYEIDKREVEIGLLNTINTNQENTLISLIVGLLVLVLLAYMLYRSNKTIKKTNNDLSSQKQIITHREQEKALLLKELNHRVKNNLQMISSLLSLQSRELQGHPAQEAILTGKNRVEALSLVHRKLYQEGVETRIFLKEYIEELVLGLFHGYNAKFKPDFEIDNANLSVDTAIPLALIINEVVVNSLKYAYVNIDYPVLKVKVQEVMNQLEIIISDNGVGFSIEESEKANSFGIKLIKSLIEQLEGTIERSNNMGTHWMLRIKIA